MISLFQIIFQTTNIINRNEILCHVADQRLYVYALYSVLTDAGLLLILYERQRGLSRNYNHRRGIRPTADYSVQRIDTARSRSNHSDCGFIFNSPVSICRHCRRLFVVVANDVIIFIFAQSVVEPHGLPARDYKSRVNALIREKINNIFGNVQVDSSFPVTTEPQFDNPRHDATSFALILERLPR